LRGAEPSSELTLDVSALLDRAAAVTNDRVVGLISHGSAARGEASTSSDVDVLVIVEGGVPLTRDAYRRWDAEGADANDSNIDAHFVHLPEDPRSAGGVWCEAAIDGVVLADSRGLVARALRDVRRAISEGRLVRKTAHGQPYWTAA
jgi:predicted nucleotidyltransferase